MTYLHTILAYPSKPRLKGALNRIYGYLSTYRAGKDKPAKDRSPRAARSPDRLPSVPETSKGRLFPGGHRIGDRHPRRDRRRQAHEAAIVQRKTLGSGHAGLGHVGVRTGSVARVGAARMASCGRGTHGGVTQRMRDGWLIWNELSLRDVLRKAFGLPVSNAMGVERNATNPVPQGQTT